MTYVSDTELDNEQFAALERIVDCCGIQDVLMALSEIAALKAEHVRANWQDENTAKAWERIEGLLGVTSTKV